ncbi:MAG TPA: hypothetical protein CFH84_11585 [Sulfurimonas sp. UBA12504]|nr:MAG TPA: hypothetical protein CFH84_11585 [Sulfurimonas sp. UBA12504]
MDKNYWDEFYKYNRYENDIQQHSTFAEFCQLEFFHEKKFNIIELGSGNGRDSIFFVKNNHNVVAIEQSDVAIDIEKAMLLSIHKENIVLKNTNFIFEDYSNYSIINIFYSRFTMHAISEKDEDLILSKVYESLKKGGLFCVEARTIKDPMYGTGKALEEHAFYTDHYRRFIDSDVFIKKVLHLGFKINYFLEKNNLSIYKNDNPVLMRIILEK